MSLQEVWGQVGAGISSLLRTNAVDGPRLTPQQIEDALRSRHDWLTVKSLSTFDPKDFQFLESQQLTRLTELVQEFRAVTATLRRWVPATESQIEQAIPLVREMIQLFEYDRYSDPEALRIGKLIERNLGPDRPKWLADLYFKTGVDWMGNPSLRIWAIVEDEALEGDDGQGNARFLETALTEVTREVEPERWPFLGIRTVSEMIEIQEEQPA